MSCVLGSGSPRPGTPRPGTPRPGTPRPGTPRPGIPHPSTVPPDIPLLLGSQRPGAPRPSPLQLQALQVNRNIEESHPTSPNNSTANRNLFPSHLPSLPDVTQGGGFQSLAGGRLQSVSEASRLIRNLFSHQVQRLPESEGKAPSCSYGKTDDSKEFLCMLDKFQKEVKGGFEVLNDVEDKELRKQIVAKEDLLEKQRSLAKNFVQYKKEEYAQLITGVEQARNLKARKDEELFRLDFERAQIIRECEDQNEFVEHLTNQKRKFQEITPNSMNAFKEAIGTLEQELKDLKTKHAHYHEHKKQKQGELERPGPNLALLDYISKKIEVKEGELECPVCYEVASAPIFMCSSEHLVCSACRTRVTRCPECRKTYTIERRRHRFAEKAAEELEVLYRERAEVLGD